MLYLIGLGLGKHSISYEGIKIVKKCTEIYLENYTSVQEGSIEEFESLFNKKMIIVDRDFVETKIESLFEKSKSRDIAFLIIGDVHSATTHIDVYLRAKNKKIPVKVIPGVSILTAIGIVGLSLYNYGKVISIPFDNKHIKSAYESYLFNQNNNLHTLFLLDLDTGDNRFLSIKEACNYLIERGVEKATIAIGCTRLGFKNFKIKTGTISSLQTEDFGNPPYCLIVPSKKLHFKEEEAIELWK